MFSSIRFKLLFFMILNIMIFAFFLYGSNSIFAKKFYTENKKKVLVENSELIREIIKGVDVSAGGYDYDISYQVNRLERNIGGVVVIGKLDGTLYYSKDPNPNRPISPQSKENPFFIIDTNSREMIKPAQKKVGDIPFDIKSWEIFNKDSFFITIQDPHLKIETLRFQTDLENGVSVLVWVPMDQISESVYVSNTFTEIITLFSILITVLLSFFISNTFSRPIRDMNIIAKKMAELDFSETLEITGKDEIFQLSQSINHLSQKLDAAISELNTKNQQLEQDIDRERRLDQIRTEFVSNVSHELKTPIFLIQGYAEGLKTNISNNEGKRNFYCDVIMEESEKMDTLVKDLLHISEMESGTFSVNRIDFDIAVHITDIINKLEAILLGKAISVEMEIKKDIIVNADPVRIEQIIVNYLNNAINYVDEKKIIRITSRQDNMKVKVMVYNSGEHIPEDALEKIWTSFYKVDKARTREYGGTGLGLSIVSAIQKAHKNECGVNNVAGGVEFWFDIDLATEGLYTEYDTEV